MFDQEVPGKPTARVRDADRLAVRYRPGGPISYSTRSAGAVLGGGRGGGARDVPSPVRFLHAGLVVVEAAGAARCDRPDEAGSRGEVACEGYRFVGRLEVRAEAGVAVGEGLVASLAERFL